MLKTSKNLNIHCFGVFFLILAIVAPWFNLHISNHDIVKSYFSYLGISLLLLTSYYYKSRNHGISFKINHIKISFLLLFLFGLLSIFWAANFDLAINKFLLWLVALFSFVLALNLTITNENTIVLSWYLSLAAGIIVVIGLIQYFFDPFMLTQAMWPASTFGNKNMATQVIVLLFPLSIFLYLSEEVQDLKKWVLSIIIAVIVSYVILSGTRAAWLSIAVQSSFIFIYLLITRKKTSQWFDLNLSKVVTCIFSLILILLIINIDPNGGFKNSLIDISERLVTTGSESDGASLQRLQIWNTAIAMISDSPFIGSGLGSFSQNLGNNGYATWTINNTLRAHNDLLELGVELGLIGLIFFSLVLISLLVYSIKILQKTTGRIHMFFLLTLTSLIGSFINLQFSFPYQMTVPLLLFGLYSGFIAQFSDILFTPIKSITFSISSISKKYLLLISTVLISLIFYLTYFQWIIAYEKFDKITKAEDFSKLQILNTPVYEQKYQFMLYSLGGNYFNRGLFSQSKLLDRKFLEFWPNHLDVLYRAAFAEHKLGNNKLALQMVKQLKELEPEGLYNSYIVEMFIYLDENKISELEKSFNKLISKPEEKLKLNDDTYRFLIFFTLASKNLSKYAPQLYEKFIKHHGYSCEVENNTAIHYFNLENFDKASMHVQNTIEKEQKCLNPDLIRILKEMKLLV